MVKSGLVLQGKFDALEDRCNLELMERHEVVSSMVLALIARVHHFQLGKPGTAKSRSINTIRSHIGGLQPHDYFKHLLTKTSTPEELFGPPDIAALKAGRYRRITDLTLEVAKFAFIDEIWKGSAAILNGLLWAINEREFKNDGKIIEIPLVSLFCASNELPEGGELQAMFDRIQFRQIIRRLSEQGNFIQMLKLSKLDKVGALVEWSDIELASQEALKVEIPNEIYEAMNSVRNDLKQKGIEPSDRRFADSMAIVQASAWRRGETIAELEDLRPLKDVLWEAEEHIPTVESILLNLASPLDNEIKKLLDEVESLDAQFSAIMADKDMEETERMSEGMEIHGKTGKANKEFEKLEVEVQKSGKSSKRLETLRIRLETLFARMLDQLFDITDTSTKLGGS